MHTNPAVEQNENIKWSESPWNHSGMKGKGQSMEVMISRKVKSEDTC